jgi:hypothetical protein
MTEIEFHFLQRIEQESGIALSEYGLSRTTSVESMNDGGMGSLLFFPPAVKIEGRQRLRAIVTGEFRDQDETLVSFEVNIDLAGKLFELDVWRVDSRPLIRFPSNNDPCVAKQSS